MAEPANTRIYSLRADDPACEEAIDRFVLTLAERVDALQDAQIAGDLEGVGKLCEELASDADTLGYPQLAAAAREVLSISQRRAPEDDALVDRLVELTEIGRRVRLGHRGAF
jgi:hypothetical protein